MGFWDRNNGPADAEGAGKGRFAAPPSCPRCELTKSQMNRTIQNYQKAYRKKVEGLKTELGSTRADNAQLRAAVKRLRRAQYASIPSLAIGIAVGVLGSDRIRAALRGLKQRLDELRSSGGKGGKAAVAGDGDDDAYEQPAAAPQGADA